MTDERDEAFDAAFGDGASAPEPQTTEPVSEVVEASTTDEQPTEKAAPTDSPIPGRSDEEFKGYLDEREKRQKFEAEAEALRREIETLKQSQQRRDPTPVPDMFEDPEGYRQYQDQRILSVKVDQSLFFAEKEFGKEEMQKVDAWIRTQPAEIARSLVNHPSPYHAAREAYLRDQSTSALAEHGYDIEALVRARMEQMTAAAGQSVAQPQTQNPANLPPKVTSSGGVQQSPNQSEEQVFRSVFS